MFGALSKLFLSSPSGTSLPILQNLRIKYGDSLNPIEIKKNFPHRADPPSKSNVYHNLLDLKKKKSKRNKNEELTSTNFLVPLGAGLNASSCCSWGRAAKTGHTIVGRRKPSPLPFNGRASIASAGGWNSLSSELSRASAASIANSLNQII